MKYIISALLSSAAAIPFTIANPVTPASPASADQPRPSKLEIKIELVKHAEGSKKLAHDQDELSADVQDLIDEQTDPAVIKLLREIEVIMADATDLLEQQNTGGATIATETEVIEKIFEAAKKKKEQQEKKDGG